MPAAPRKLWRCPECGHEFVTRNMSHSCGRFRIGDHFTGKPKALRETFNRFVDAAKACGPVKVYAQKSRLVIQAEVRFLNVVVRKDWIDAHIWLKRRVEHPLLHKIEDYKTMGFGARFKLRTPGDIDAEIEALVRESYRLGTRTGSSFDDVRALGRKLPGVVESTSYGTVALKVGGKLMARLKEDGETLVVMVDMTSRDFLLRDEPTLFYITDHYRDYPAVLLRLPAVTIPRLQEALEDAWSFVAPPKLKRSEI